MKMRKVSLVLVGAGPPRTGSVRRHSCFTEVPTVPRMVQVGGARRKAVAAPRSGVPRLERSGTELVSRSCRRNAGPEGLAFGTVRLRVPAASTPPSGAGVQASSLVCFQLDDKQNVYVADLARCGPRHGRSQCCPNRLWEAMKSFQVVVCAFRSRRDPMPAQNVFRPSGQKCVDEVGKPTRDPA